MFLLTEYSFRKWSYAVSKYLRKCVGHILKLLLYFFEANNKNSLYLSPVFLLPSHVTVVYPIDMREFVCPLFSSITTPIFTEMPRKRTKFFRPKNWERKHQKCRFLKQVCIQRHNCIILCVAVICIVLYSFVKTLSPKTGSDL